jgi:hypothetical protein
MQFLPLTAAPSGLGRFVNHFRAMRAETSSALHRSESAKRVNVYARRCNRFKSLFGIYGINFFENPLKAFELRYQIKPFGTGSVVKTS